MKYRKDIDGLRTLAVLPVILYHADLAFSGGFVGVDVFFVISGFLIVGLIYDEMTEGRFSFADFYARRIRRLYPALFVVLLATTTWATAKMLWVDLEAYAASLLSTVFYASNFYFYSQTGYFTEEATIKPLLHTWSLAVEEQFYLVVPFLLLGLVAWVPRKLYLQVVAVLVALSFALSVVLTAREGDLAFYLLPTRAWELGIGGILALAGPGWAIGRRWLAEGLGLAGLVAIAYAVLTFEGSMPFPGWRAAIPTLGAAAVIAAGTVPQTLTARLLSLPPMVFTGRISYPLYLWHWPVIVLFVYGPLDPLTTKEGLAVVAITFVLSILTWFFIERPIRSFRVFPAGRNLFLAAAAGSSLAVSAGLGLIAAGGLPGRHDPALVAMVQEKGLLDKARWLHDRRECHLLSRRQIIAGDVCVRGADGVEPTFILAGDSHADAASPGIFAAARDLGLTGWHFTMPGFLPLPGRHQVGINSLREVDDFMTFLRDRPAIRTVIATGWWARARTGRSYRNPNPAIFVDEEHGDAGMGHNAESFDTALDKLVQAFPDRRFIFLDDVPSGRTIDIKGYVRTFAVTGQAPLAGLPRAAADSQRAIYEPALMDLAARNPNVTYVPVFDALCDDSLCPLFDTEGRPIFRDGDHLSNVGALSLTEAMKRALALALPEAVALDAVDPAP